MNKTQEYLSLLSIFHYIIGGMVAFYSLLPLTYLTFGLFFIISLSPASHPPLLDSGNVEFLSASPARFGSTWNLFGATWFLLGQALAISTIISGRWLRKYKGYWFSLIVAFLLCIYLPLGTVLGILTIVVLSRQSVKQLYLNKKEKGQLKREFQPRYDIEDHQILNFAGDLNSTSTKEEKREK